MAPAALPRIRDRVHAAGLKGSWITSDKGEIPRGVKGAYLLLVGLEKALSVGAGRHRTGYLPAGTYLYAGSAYGAGGLSARIGRHFRKDKKVHWHIDRLTLEAGTLAAFSVEGGDECRLVRTLIEAGGMRPAMAGFGSTDCRTCLSHLLAMD